MRDRETIDSELRQLAAELRSIREHGGEPSIRQLDELLDERLGHRAKASEKPRLSPTPGRTATKPTISRLGRKGALRRFGLLAALPLSLVATVTVLVVMFAVHNPHPAAQPTVVPPSSARPNPPPSGAQPEPVAPKLNAPPLGHPSTADIVDRALIDALKQVGVPVPSPEYAMKQGHAVCDFLAHQPELRRGRPLRAAIDDMGCRSKRRVCYCCHRLVLPSARTHELRPDAKDVPGCSRCFASHPRRSAGHPR